MRRFRTRWPLVGQICLVIAVGVGVLVVAGPTPGAFPGANGKIAFVSDRSGPLVTNDVWIMNADGSDQVNLTNVAPGAGAFTTSESFSADGARIVFNGNVAVPYDGPHLYVMDSDGSNMSQLTSGWPQYAQPGWSPDGTKIVFYGTPSGSIDFSDIYTMNADGSNPVRLTESGAESSPKWSPDGGRIMFESWRDGNGEIYVMNADGSGQTNLTNNPAMDDPRSWSPDSKRIAFSSRRDGDWEIYVMNADGTGQTNLTNNSAADWHPAWSPQ
jgi:Tol biopolymer transport system component